MRCVNAFVWYFEIVAFKQCIGRGRRMYDGCKAYCALNVYLFV